MTTHTTSDADQAMYLLKNFNVTTRHTYDDGRFTYWTLEGETAEFDRGLAEYREKKQPEVRERVRFKKQYGLTHRG